MKALLLQAVLLVQRRHALAASTRQQYRIRLDRDLDTIMALGPTHRHGQRLRKRYGEIRSDLFTFLTHLGAPPDNKGSEREHRPTATCPKVKSSFHSEWGASLFASIRSVVGTAARSVHRRPRNYPQPVIRMQMSLTQIFLVSLVYRY